MMQVMTEETAQGPDAQGTALAAARGDRAAFARLVNDHYDIIHRVALRWTGNRDDAEDIAQSVCMKLGQAIRGFRGESRFSTWLYRLTINAARDHHRMVAREARRADALAVQALVDHQPGKPDWPPEDETGALWAAVHELPDKTRDAVILVYAEEMTHAEAARVLECKEATVSWHIHEAKKRLAALLRPDGETQP